MKRALVLSGGGSRGAYECGAWQALCELDVRIDAVYGTSIGALNAALVAQGDLSRGVRLWENITIRQILDTGTDEEFSMNHMITRKRDVIPFLIENAKNIHMDITPLEQLLQENIDEGRVRASGMTVGMMITRVPQFSACEMRLNDIPSGRLSDYVLASASCFPVFPLRDIDGHKYMDGGYVDNMPIGMAIEDGADEIVAVDIHPQPTHPEYGCMPFLKLIHPLHDLGGFLDFNPRLLKRSRMMGYYDTMKAYGAFDGIRYTFRRVNELRYAEAARRFARMAAGFDADTSVRNGDASLIGAIGGETPLRALNWKDTLLRGLELCAQVLEFREDAIYDFAELTQRILRFARSVGPVDKPSGRGIQEAAQGGGRMLTVYLYAATLTDPEFLTRMVRRLADYPQETVAAMYLVCMDSVGV